LWFASNMLRKEQNRATTPSFLPRDPSSPRTRLSADENSILRVTRFCWKKFFSVKPGPFPAVAPLNCCAFFNQSMPKSLCDVSNVSPWKSWSEKIFCTRELFRLHSRQASEQHWRLFSGTEWPGDRGGGAKPFLHFGELNFSERNASCRSSKYDVRCVLVCGFQWPLIPACETTNSQGTLTIWVLIGLTLNSSNFRRL